MVRNHKSLVHMKLRYFYYACYFVLFTMCFQGCVHLKAQDVKETCVFSYKMFRALCLGIYDGILIGFGIIKPEPPRLPKYGVEFNPEREKIGLPVLSENWMYRTRYGSRDNLDMWFTPIDTTPCYFSKKVFFNNDTIIQEIDTYVGSQVFATNEGDEPEQLFITYFFVRNKDDNDSLKNVRWKRTLETGVKFKEKCLDFFGVSSYECYHMEYFTLTKESADSVLVSWGLKTP